MRVTICREGNEDIGTLIANGALTWDDEIPLCWNFNFDVGSVLGKATDIQRSEFGDITAEIVFNTEQTSHGKFAESLATDDDTRELYAFTVYITNIEQVARTRKDEHDKEVQYREVTQGKIKAIAMVPAAGIPWRKTRCLSSAVLPTEYNDLKRCALMAPHKGQWHRWEETPEGHDRVPLIVEWDDHKCIKIIQGSAG